MSRKANFQPGAEGEDVLERFRGALESGVSLGTDDGGFSFAALTTQQARVFALLSEGIPNKEIAWKLGICESTVKFYVSCILKATGCSNRTQAALFALRLSYGLPLNIDKFEDRNGTSNGNNRPQLVG